MKNLAASALAKRRWAKTTKKQRSEHAKMMVDAREARREGIILRMIEELSK